MGKFKLSLQKEEEVNSDDQDNADEINRDDQDAEVKSCDFSESDDPLDSLQSLHLDELRLSEQKEHLSDLLGKLETKAKEELERRKQKVLLLNAEVGNLKRKCEKISTWLSKADVAE